MEKKLRMARIDFDYACFKKLEEKEELGWEDWDNPAWKGTFIERIKNLLKCELNQKNLVNIANYCNFLWSLIEAEMKGGEKDGTSGRYEDNQRRGT